MSSSMLEQAVIDAQALKEAAVKNAEQEVLEKYSGEIKEAVNSLLEQEDPMAMDPMAMDIGMGAPTVDPLAAPADAGKTDVIATHLPLKALDSLGLNDIQEGDEIDLDLDALVKSVTFGNPEEEIHSSDKQLMFEASDADLRNLLEDIEEDVGVEVEEPSWSFQEMKAAVEGAYPPGEETDELIMQTLGGDQPMAESGGDEDEALHSPGVRYEESLYEDEEERPLESPLAEEYLDEEVEEIEFGEEEGSHITVPGAKTRGQVARQELAHGQAGDQFTVEIDRERFFDDLVAPKFAAQGELEEDLDEDSIAQAIDEILKVDLENVPRGMLGTTHPTRLEQEYAVDVAAAAAQDTANKEENEEFQKALKQIVNLEEHVKSLKSSKNRLVKEHKELKSVARQISNKLSEINTANAKLVYQNRILKSHSLNERQKDKLVEAVSNANSIEEAKVIYETLQDSLSSKDAKAPQNLNEAISKNNRLVLKSNNKETQVSDSATERMKRLAGII